MKKIYKAINFNSGISLRVLCAFSESSVVKYFSLLLFFAVISISLAFSQSQKQWLKHAEKSWSEKDFYGASVYYREAMKVDSSNIYVVYKYAECLRFIHDYKKAEYYYDYVLRRDRSGQYPDALFWMAMMKKQNGKYLDARKNFLSYKSKLKDKNSYQYKKTEQEIASCEEAAILVKSKPKARIYNLGDSLNSKNGEFAPVISSDSTILFSAINYDIVEDKQKKKIKDQVPFIKIYEASRRDTLYTVKKELDSLINSAGTHNANGAYDQNGNFYFTRCDQQNNCKIFVQKKNNETVPVDSKINLEGTTNTQIHIADLDSLEVFFFVSNRTGGYGGLDIWYTIKSDSGFSMPLNAGPEINTVDDEITPFYDVENKVLYFSSTWHKGLGGFDIFKSKGDPGSFSKVENAGIPFNSGANDMYFTLDNETKTGFVTSNRKGSYYEKIETCCNDIWWFRLIEEPKKRDTIPVIPPDPLADLQIFIPIKLYFHNDEPNPKTRDTLTNLNYKTTCQDYVAMIETYKEKYSEGLEGEKKKAAQDSIESFFAKHVQKGLDELNEFAGELIKQLDKGYKLDLTVIGHASPLAKTDYNVNLTLRRISSLENFLREYNNGVYIPYLNDSASNGGSLKIIRIPFGEYKAEHYISDNLNDKKSSVYSIEAALNRNIEIVSLTLEHKDSLFSRIAFRKEIFDAGDIHAGKKIHHTFRFKNNGNSDLKITGFETNCECISVTVPQESIAPGGKGEISVEIDAAGKTGKQIFSVTLLTNGKPERKQLTVTAEIK